MALDSLRSLLQRCHDTLDDFNARGVHPNLVYGCAWCKAKGYDAQGMRHDADCILMELRQVLHASVHDRFNGVYELRD